MIEEDIYMLWYEIDTSYLKLSGSNKVRWSGDGENQLFYNLNNYGLVESSIFFYCIPEYIESKAEYDVTYMAGLPYSKNGDELIKISDNIKRQGYFSKDKQMYFYRLREEQYEQLEKRFYEAENQAIEKLEEVTYTYEELFGIYNK